MDSQDIQDVLPEDLFADHRIRYADADLFDLDAFIHEGAVASPDDAFGFYGFESLTQLLRSGGGLIENDVLVALCYACLLYTSLYHRNENVCVRVGGDEKVSIPALTLENIVCFGVNTVSTPLIGFCGERGIALTFLSGSGRFLGRVTGPVSGNVLLRKAQYASAGEAGFVTDLVRDLLYAKPVSYTHLDVYKRQTLPSTPCATAFFTAAARRARAKAACIR